MSREQMNIVVVGHVDHGKSTVIGRLMADTGSLPQGKLEQVKTSCRKNSRPFEYAFLLDALKDEQAQGITIDTARCFFKTARRDYIIIDAPGHVEFLKNMVTGAARAEAALLVIDANEGVQDNSRRHGYMLSMLGIRQVVVLVNKMDLVDYDMRVFERVRDEYAAFLSEVGITPIDFVPISAREGENIAHRASWHSGSTVLEHIDSFTKETDRGQKPFRFPIQDIYKFTENDDDRRILAGTVETGSIRVGDEVVFLPSRKRSTIRTIEEFNCPAALEASAGTAAGFTLTEELYVKPGEIMCRAGEKAPALGSRFRASIFWMGKSPMIPDRKYKLKLTTTRVSVRLAEIISVLDAADLSSTRRKHQVDRHDVAECILETTRPVACDVSSDIEATGRFVIVDNYEIAGGGIVLETISDGRSTLEEHVSRREAGWERSGISQSHRERRYGHKSKFLVVTGESDERIGQLGRALEKRLFDAGFIAYYLGISNIDRGLDSDVLDQSEMREERIRRLGEVARILTDSGQIFITSIAGLDRYDLEQLKLLNAPNEILVASLGATDSEIVADIVIPESEGGRESLDRVFGLLRREEIIPDYCI